MLWKTIMNDYSDTTTHIFCDHCGEDCTGNYPKSGDLSFCCQGCETIWNLLKENDLSSYYDLDNLPGISAKRKKYPDYNYLDDKKVQDRLIAFSVDHIHTIFFDLPQIHCTACVWLLENLNRINPGVLESRVNFLKKQCTVIFDDREITLVELVGFLDRIGYTPSLNFNQLDNRIKPLSDKSLIYKIGVAGFSFGNIMLLSFPDYLGLEGDSFTKFFGYLNIALALPVLLYSGRNYIDSAWQSLQLKRIGIDMPIAIGMLTLFLRSIYEIVLGGGVGYLDSLSGFILFLLVGRWFQARSYESISFERDYRSFFPIAVQVFVNGKWRNKIIDNLQARDTIMVRNQEIIPCDGVLLQGKARLDYSFVTGESKHIYPSIGDSVSAGGKQLGHAIQVQVTHEVEQSKLTKLWNEDIFNKRDIEKENIILNLIGKYFTIVILIIAIFTLVYWWFIDITQAFNSFTSVLIIACPCVLALSVPFIYGNALRLLSKSQFYCKNVFTLFDLSDIDIIVFDKTGTITDSEELKAEYQGKELTTTDMDKIKSLCFLSNHVLSKSIAKSLEEAKIIDIDSFIETPGQGIKGSIGKTIIKIGSSKYIRGSDEINASQTVYIEINGIEKGYFRFDNSFRKNIANVIRDLADKYDLAVLSGDNSAEKERVESLFPKSSDILFNQSPNDKLTYILNLQQAGKKVIMVGDGLNDAGALKSSDVGIVISSEENNFTPASDVIVSATSFSNFSKFIKYSYHLKYALYGAFLLALLYNSIGLGFAVSGHLTPIVAAILMPISSFSIMIYGLATSYILKPKRIKEYK